MTVDFSGLTKLLNSPVITPEDSKPYNEFRRMANSRIDKKPMAIVRCHSVADVQEAVCFANKNNIHVSPRSGGNGYCGDAMINDGIVLDLREMNNVHVDPETKLLKVDSGANINQVLRALKQYNLIMPLGSGGEVGISGYILGGGWSDLSRYLGMGCDSMISAEIVLSDGRCILTSKDENPELFWALKGCGAGHFGVVTSMTFQLHDVNDKMPTLTAVVSLDNLEMLLVRYLEMFSGDDVSDRLTLIFAVTDVPEVGLAVHITGVYYNGTEQESNKFFSELMQGVKPIMVDNRFESYFLYKERTNSLIKKEESFYSVGGLVKLPINIKEITNATILALNKKISATPVVYFAPIGGKIDNYGDNDSPLVQRNHKLMWLCSALWTDRNHEVHASWCREYKKLMKPYITGLSVNEVDHDIEDWQAAYFGDNYEKLRQIKKRYDPSGLFVNTHQNLL